MQVGKDLVSINFNVKFKPCSQHKPAVLQRGESSAAFSEIVNSRRGALQRSHDFELMYHRG